MFNKRGFYLIADAHTGKVFRKSRERATVAELHFMTLPVEKQAWKRHGRHDTVRANDLDDDTRAIWIAALASHTFMECPQCGTRRVRRDTASATALCAVCDGRVCPICRAPKSPSNELCPDRRGECRKELKKQQEEQRRKAQPYSVPLPFGHRRP